MRKPIDFLKQRRNGAMDEHIERFVKPSIDRAKAAGLTDEQIEAMWNEALHKSNPMIVGHAPGSIFQDLVSRAIKQKEDE